MLLALLFACFADFVVPPLTGPVVDQAGIMSGEARQTLDQYLRQLVQRGGAQIQVVTLPDLGGISIEEAATKLTDSWKLGKKKEDRGVLLLMAAKEHRIRIEVGLGLQGNLPDITASRIIREVMVPRMREGHPDNAVMNGVLAIIHYTDPNLSDGGSLPERPQTAKRTNVFHLFTTLLWLIFFFAFVLGRRRGSGLFWLGFLGGSGFGGGGGGSSGGFGGWSGGGGGFNGGGASGDW